MNDSSLSSSATNHRTMNPCLPLIPRDGVSAPGKRIRYRDRAPFRVNRSRSGELGRGL